MISIDQTLKIPCLASYEIHLYPVLEACLVVVLMIQLWKPLRSTIFANWHDPCILVLANFTSELLQRQMLQIFQSIQFYSYVIVVVHIVASSCILFIANSRTLGISNFDDLYTPNFYIICAWLMVCTVSSLFSHTVFYPCEVICEAALVMMFHSGILLVPRRNLGPRVYGRHPTVSLGVRWYRE